MSWVARRATDYSSPQQFQQENFLTTTETVPDSTSGFAVRESRPTLSQTRDEDKSNGFLKSPEMNSKAAKIANSISPEGGPKSPRPYSSREYIALRKLKSINNLMEILDEWTNSKIDTAVYAHHACSPSNGSPAKSTAHSSSSGENNSSSRRLAGQKRSLQSDGSDGSDHSDDGNGKGRRDTKRPKKDFPRIRKLACPYFKHDPARYQKGSCTGPGYTTIARLKEHIYRCHKQPEHSCARCREAFPDREALDNHLRAEEPCKLLRRLKALDDISEAQYQKLKKKSSPNKPAGKRWEEVYRIIFPLAQEIPTPYYDYDEGKPMLPVPKEIEQYDQYLQDELAPRVREELERRYDRFEEKIKDAFVDIVRSVFGNLYQEYRQGRGAAKSPNQSRRLETAQLVELPSDVVDSFWSPDLYSFQPYEEASLQFCASDYHQPSTSFGSGLDSEYGSITPPDGY
ncbi:uncharacterized protein BCR38DRAFT_490763 [Pseudomassariella vexata]|uniref:C2H2-type domain-containing protein n=1 Tax=Pseudomassariella vexata TaxID=1141098 RepID=A0A1Y2DAC3_9PEZI|nr:uncharacterized protein BCR38DRAFT_490763 [Pseudomassariella vexata]ORY56104.1 hypothetical protein BCR38DRAFT_490763 [Pseudomassariella vexata]